ncbi:serine protease [Streptomyces sp. QH1-20]|uniref:trypsin-like serine peptidase n=1 Tax=Streptomyces sp. QH1-20 TaxID=3240934 RepID=UPI003519CB48
MRLKATDRGYASGPAGTAALIATVLALIVIGLLMASRGQASDAPLAEGDADGHYEQPRALGDKSAEAMRSVVRTPAKPPVPAPAPVGSGSDPLPASKPLEARESDPSPAVGPLFYTGEGEPDHSCSASVVHSPRGDLIATAAHCVYQREFRTDIAFVPGYHDGRAPYGVWVPTSIDIAPEWAAGGDQDHDVAFLRVRRVDDDTPIERVTGAERIRFRPEPNRPARVIGYPIGEERPLACQNTTGTRGPTQLRFECHGLPNGTSGGPVLTDIDPATGLGTVNGVLGGFQGGGDDETSYSSYFGDAIEKLYRRATG